MDNENTSPEVSASKGRSKVVPVVVLILIVLAVVGYFVLGSNKIKNLVGVKAESVATVNGVAIPKADYDTQFASAVASYKTQGVDVTSTTTLAQIKTQTLDTMINNELVAQGVATAGIKPTDAEIETQYQTILTQVGGADKLKEELVKAKLTDVQLRENIKKQLAAQTYLLQNIDVKSITATDAEVAQFYTDYSKQQTAAGQKVPDLKTLSDQIKQQIVSNKQQTMITNFITTLRAKATIVNSI